MRTACRVGCLVAALCLGLFASSVMATEVVKVGEYPGPWYVTTDPVVVCLADLTWNPDSGDKRDFEEVGPDLVSVNRRVQRPVCWRWEAGAVAGISWRSVQAQLQTKFACKIGEMVDVWVSGNVEASSCYRVTVDVYAPYDREIYRVTQDGHVAVISVLVPVDGVALLYRNLNMFANPSCTLVPKPASSPCCHATMALNPVAVGGRSPGGVKQHFRDEPGPSPGRREEATWGKIKALYEGE